MTDQTPVPIYCTVCGRDGGLLALSGPCLSCTKARARAARDRRCHCGSAVGSYTMHRHLGRTWSTCDRCLGTVAQFS